MGEHRHRPGRSREARSLRERSVGCYRGPVRYPGDWRHEPRAGGNVCYVEVCACGATRTTNVNSPWREVGPWVP